VPLTNAHHYREHRRGNFGDFGPDLGKPNALYQPADYGPVMTVSDAWTSVLAGLRITIVDSPSKNKVWVGEISKKVRDTQKLLLNLDTEVDKLMSLLLKTFPPK
jgi:hypothetical protein